VIAGDTVTMFPDYEKEFIPFGPKDCRFAFPMPLLFAGKLVALKY
jgi:hypothetical protein